MYMMKQGDITNSKRVDELEKRIEALENLLKGLQLAPKPKVGRPPRVTNEPNQLASSDSSSD
jgi:hypothetical protein